MQDQTILKYTKNKVTTAVTLQGIWSLAKLMGWVNKRNGDPFNMRFTRKYANGRQASFTVTNGELKSMDEVRLVHSNLLLNG